MGDKKVVSNHASYDLRKKFDRLANVRTDRKRCIIYMGYFTQDGSDESESKLLRNFCCCFLPVASSPVTPGWEELTCPQMAKELLGRSKKLNKYQKIRKLKSK